MSSYHTILRCGECNNHPHWDRGFHARPSPFKLSLCASARDHSQLLDLAVFVSYLRLIPFPYR